MGTRSAQARLRVRMDLESLSDRAVPAAIHYYAIGQDIGGTGLVQVFREDGTFNGTLAPYAPSFTGGVRVATGDVNGDGVDDIVVAPGPGGGPQVKVIDGASGSTIDDFFAYDPGFLGGVNVAVGDVNGDGRADIITGTGIGGGPNVKVFDGASGQMLDSFFAYESSFRGGVNVAAGDVNGDGKADIVTGTGFGGGPRVQVHDGATGAEIGNFFAYDPSFRNGVTVAAGDLGGTGLADIATGVGNGGGPNVRIYDGMSDDLINSYFAYDPAFQGGISVEVARLNGVSDLLVAPGPSAGGYVEIFSGTSSTGVTVFQPFPNFMGGITTGQGVATVDAPFSSVFATPLALSGSGTPGGDSSSGDGGNNNNFNNDCYVYIYDPSRFYIPPLYDPTLGYIPDTSSYTPDTTYYGDSSDYSDYGDYGCGCGDTSYYSDSGGYDSGSYDSGSYDSGSYDSGSYDSGSYDSGSYSDFSDGSDW